MIIMAFESSCDETSVSIIKDNMEVLSCAVASQIAVHTQFGGVFPEVASRLHTEQINIVIREALEDAKINLDQIDAIAVTQGPGLAGALHIGMMAAKTLAFSLDIPLIPVHHLAGHIYANLLQGPMIYPLLALVISGGHTELVYMCSEFDFEVVGTTQDDAVGEAYDKVARQLGLSYPGGPIIDKCAQLGAKQYILPKVKTENPLDFSFSGLKSAVRQLVLKEERDGKTVEINNMAFAFQEAAVNQLMERVQLALEKYPAKQFLLAGGVAANSRIRDRVSKEITVPFMMPPVWACMDQAAMIGLAGAIAFERGYRAKWDLSINPNMKLSTY